MLKGSLKSMNSEVKDSVFSLLYAVVLIDKRVVKVETETFFAKLEGFLHTFEGIEELRAKDIIANWFIKNYKNILKEMKTSRREGFLLNHVENLKTYGKREQVFHMMSIVAHADDDFHDEERAFLTKVAGIWGLEDSLAYLTGQ